MIKSMTGYGTAHYTDNNIEISVEVKSLNSKFLDANIRLSRNFSDKEIEVRNIVSAQLARGKVSVNIEFQKLADDNMSIAFNKELFKAYYKELSSLAKEVGDNTQDLFRLALQSPDVNVIKSDNTNDESNWTLIKESLEKALEQCSQFRIDEGKSLEDKLKSYIREIKVGLDKVVELDPSRVQSIRKRIEGNIEQFVEEEKIDKNRLEQELIYYIEKLDISEEKVRLLNHLEHFTEVLHGKESNGKKLGFIAQEIGREINTIGSKANDSDIQRLVVGMKEELEKIKEQVLNVL